MGTSTLGAFIWFLCVRGILLFFNWVLASYLCLTTCLDKERLNLNCFPHLSQPYFWPSLELSTPCSSMKCSWRLSSNWKVVSLSWQLPLRQTNLSFSTLYDISAFDVSKFLSSSTSILSSLWYCSMCFFREELSLNSLSHSRQMKLQLSFEWVFVCVINFWAVGNLRKQTSHIWSISVLDCKHSWVCFS